MRIITLIMTDLASDKMKAEEKLQRLINNKDKDLDDNIKEIKDQLKVIVLVDQMILKWKDYTATDEDNNNNNNNNNKEV